MGNRFRRAAVVMMVFLDLAARAGAEGRPSIAVIAYDQAAVSADVLERAKADVSRIFDDAGVRVTWINPSTPELAHGRFAVRMLIRRHAKNATERVMGMAIVNAGEAGGSASVFYQRVLESAHGRGQDVARVLAYAIAHEMGHLLLPALAHGRTGIMRAEWSGDDLRHMEDGSLRFTDEEAAAMSARASAAYLKRGIPNPNPQPPIPNPQSPIPNPS